MRLRVDVHLGVNRRSGLARYAGGRSHLARVLLAGVTLSILTGLLCALLAPGSHVVHTEIGDLPVRPQDEMRVAAEVWLTGAVAVLAVLTTVLWWRPWPPRASPAGLDPVEQARGPLGLGISAAAAVVQAAIAMSIWQLTVSLRGFAAPGEIGDDRIAAPILSSAAALWVAAGCAVLTYLALTVMASTSSLTAAPPEAISPGSRRGDASVGAPSS